MEGGGSKGKSQILKTLKLEKWAAERGKNWGGCFKFMLELIQLLVHGIFKTNIKKK